MMKHFNLLFLFLTLFGLSPGLMNAQVDQPDSKGTEFWIMFNANLGSPRLLLYITSEVATSGEVNGPSLASAIPFSTTPGTITTVEVPNNQVVISSDVVEQKGLHITSDDEITVYGLNRIQFTTDAFLALPVNVLGTEYVVTSQEFRFGQSQIGIVGTENNTQVTINPTANATGHPAGTPFSITLNEGDTYQIQASGSGVLSDYSGTTVTSNKPIAVFASQECANVPVNVTFCDHLVEQVPPATTFGQQFVTVPLATRLAGDIFRFVTVTNNTQVTVTGINGFSSSFTIGPGEFQELDIPSDEYTIIQSTEPVMVVQYSKGDESDPSIVNGDPFMLLIPPFEQFLNSYTITTPDEGFNLNFVNVVAPNSAVGSVQLDGTNVPASEFTTIGTSGFSAAQVAIDIGSHTLQSASPFGVFIYGFGNDDSYGYLGGQSFGEVAIVNEIDIDLDEAIPNGDEYCFEALVTDSEGIPVEGVRVDFTVEGANTEVGFAFTNEDGIATFCYTPVNNGTDTITGTVGDNSDSGTLEISNPEPTTISLDPATATVELGEEVCLTATFVDQFGDPVEGETIDFEVSGVNTSMGSAMTDENGEAVFCYTPSEDGTDNVEASSGDISDNSTITILAGDLPDPVPTSLSVDPEITAVLLGEEVCITATVLDQFGDPYEGGMVAVEVSGDNTGSDDLVSNADGEVEFCYTPANTGMDEVSFTLGDLMAQTDVTITEEVDPPVATTLEVDPDDQTVTVGDEVCVTATLLDQYGDPFEGEMLDVDVSGANPGMGTITTDMDGEATFCYTASASGADMVTVSLGGLEAMADVSIEEPVDPGETRFRVVGPGGVIIDDNLEDGDVIDLNDWPKFNIEAVLEDEPGSLVMNLTGAMTKNQRENTARYFIHGNNGSNINVRPFAVGLYNIMATPYSMPKAKGTMGVPFDVDFEVIQPAEIIMFQMWNKQGDLVVSPMQDGDVYNLGEIPGDKFNIEAIVVPEFVGSVKMQLSGPQNQMRIENNNPYFLYPNTKGSESGMERAMDLLPGLYTIWATPYSRKGGMGSPGATLSISFEVVVPSDMVSVKLSEQVAHSNTRSGRNGMLPDLGDPYSKVANSQPETKDLGLNVLSGQVTAKSVENVRVYPNPSSGSFTVELPMIPRGETMKLWITDLKGRSMDISHMVAAGQQQVNLNAGSMNLATGVYFLNARSESMTFESVRIVLKN